MTDPFDPLFPDAEIHAIAPGRVNLLGEHVDYNDGPVLPAAIDRAVHLSAKPRSDRLVLLHARDLNQQVTFSLDYLSEHRDIYGEDFPTWATYPAGVAYIIQQHGYPISGIEAAYTSDVPIGAGLSSSAAVELAFAVTWQAIDQWPGTAMDLARLSQQAENQYAGVNCGLMDQFASANGVENHALYFDTRSLNWHPVPLPANTAIIIADSGVRRSLATSAYNDRRAACEQAVAVLKTFLPGVQALRDVSPAEFALLADRLPDTVRRRAQHVVEECERVDRAIEYLEQGKASDFGQLMFACHASLRDLYEVSCPELDLLVNLAKDLPGCLGARLTGAGFGGCTVNLVEEAHANTFQIGLKSGYLESTGRKAQVYLCRASRGAHVIEAL